MNKQYFNYQYITYIQCTLGKLNFIFLSTLKKKISQLQSVYIYQLYDNNNIIKNKINLQRERSHTPSIKYLKVCTILLIIIGHLRIR